MVGRPWYFRGQLAYYKQENNHILFKYHYVSTRVGRDFNISRKVGIGFDGGLCFQLARDRVYKIPRTSGFDLDFNYKVLPGLGLNIFYRL